jgi:hypothetical protein
VAASVVQVDAVGCFVAVRVSVSQGLVGCGQVEIAVAVKIGGDEIIGPATGGKRNGFDGEGPGSIVQ